MQRLSPVAILFSAIVLAVVPQLGCTQPGGPAANTAATPVPEATPDKAAIVAEITRIENDWPRVVKERDGAAIRRIEADDVFLVYPDGTTGGKEQDAKDIEAGTLSAESMEISEIKVTVLSKDVAVASLLNTVKNGKYKLPSGETRDIRSVFPTGQFRSVDTFVRRNGQWQLVQSATVPLKSPAPSASPSPAASAAAAASPAKAAETPPPPKPSPTRRATPAAAPAKPSPTP